ncbi:MAG TPA: S41 family peptidase [Candidatus Saccharimonadales bacterium]|nr:S41 family peptidase [Candidatus Saccharimonadales bacterium]
MQREQQSVAADVRGKKAKRSLFIATRAALIAAVAVVIFGLGVGVGNGRITFTTHGASGNLPNQLDYNSVNQVYQALKANYDGTLDSTKLLDGAKQGLAQATGDPYTEFFSASDAKDFNDELSGTFSGIGAELGQDTDGHLIVMSPIDGFPAAKAGLRAQDIVTAINGASTSGMSVDTAVDKIRGPKGSKITLAIVRDKSQQLSFTITRDDIKVPSVNWKILDGNIGYMQITQFSDDTAQLAIQAATEFKKDNVNGIVLDLRDDPGGLLDAAVQVSSLWLPQGKTVLQEKRGSVVVNTYTANGNNILQGIPTTALINAGSASAAEITAGALHDNNVATLVGVKSYGKGSVQQVLNLAGGSELKVTVARWYRPNGENIDKKGITPDKNVTMSDDDYKNGRDPQKDAALSILQR